VKLCLLLLAALPGLALAATPAPAAPVATTGGLAQVTLSLLLILGVILGLAWVATRLRLTPRVGQGAIRVLADLPLGTKERVVLLQIGEAQALVGVGADGVRSLQTLAQAIVVPAAASPPSGFALKLRSLMERSHS
jgi:flagellar protein FliO/FliZ